ncbi:hypothetical protein HNR23_002802 [Nocardiopsis mwathae]|uniref:Uncharacterized protein n=1 Tax=Nocardiopsis mwathae TaxID=1472723 RepID=A0A7X0D5R9_9ACTN|nr:hypothetical protein [Nocardiopsis mwathae]MBB6172742.1 hypothetical protein [Nocardiopsis mwathae]
MRYRRTAAATIAAAILAAQSADAGENDHLSGWRLVAEEDFVDPLRIDEVPWTLDPQGPRSPWYMDPFGDDGEVWHAISDPDFSEQTATFDVYRKRVAFGDGGWLTAEIAAVDKDRSGAPDSEPGLATVELPDGERAARIHEPSWDAGVLIRSTDPLPERYRVEMTLRDIDFGGMRDGSLEYEGKYNGYRTGAGCKTSFPWTFHGALPGVERCDYHDVTEENGFYYLGILDHPTPSPQGNPGIHFRRKVVMDGYYSQREWSAKNAVCDPGTGRIHGVEDGTYNGVNAIFIRGDRMRSGINDVGNEYYFKTACGEFSGDEPFDDEGRYSGILTGTELRPELLPEAAYTFAVERDATGYTLEMSGPFRHSGPPGPITLRFHHEFVEDGRPIWHYNRTPGAYDGAFDRSLTHTGHAGTYTTEHAWPADSAYPDTFIIGDPHLNFYEGSAVVDDIRLYVPDA